jgi:hypothetical protein
MSFSNAQYEALIQKIESGTNHAVSLVNGAIRTIENLTGWIPLIGDAIASGLNKIVSLMAKLVAKVGRILQPFAVPACLNGFSARWTAIEQGTGNIAAGIAGQLQAAGSQWQGLAGGAYAGGVSNQGPAVSDINGLAATISASANSVANFGYGFYVTVGAAILALCVSLIGAAAVFPVVAAIIGATTAIAAAYTALRLNLSAQTRTLSGKLPGNAALPGGQWPVATSS